MKKNFQIPGFKLSGVYCGLKKNPRSRDLALIVADRACSAAAVFTICQVKAAPVLYSQKIIKTGRAQAIVANSGGANAATGPAGQRDVAEVMVAAGELLNISPKLILNASTGKIGPRLKVAKIKEGLKMAAAGLAPENFDKVAAAIMTTDTRPKIIFREIRLSFGTVKIGAVAKGAGMIAPNMATMLAFILTDLKVSSAALSDLLKTAVAESFNVLNIDNCMSTNDTVFFLASGAGQKIALKNASADFIKFQNALTGLCQDLCRKMAADAEGATKLIEVTVKGAPTPAEARIVARAVAGSDLVKAAVFGGDPNWGRILAAAGGCGVKFSPDKVSVFFGNNQVVARGQAVEFRRPVLKKYLGGRVVDIILDLAAGRSAGRAFGCDLSYDYVKINAEYN